MLEFPYLPERIRGPVPPSMPPNERYFWRPLVPLRIFGSSGLVVRLDRALLDSGSSDTVLPEAAAAAIGMDLLPDQGHKLRWYGTLHVLRYAVADLQLEARGVRCRWTATIGFTPAPLRYAILGLAGCLQFFDVTFRGQFRSVALATNTAFPGTMEQPK